MTETGARESPRENGEQPPKLTWPRILSLPNGEDMITPLTSTPGQCERYYIGLFASSGCNFFTLKYSPLKTFYLFFSFLRKKGSYVAVLLSKQDFENL